jgi:protein-S-isoprenylcysteine O-methyltransferase Ste14
MLQVISLAIVIGAAYSDRRGAGTFGEGNAIRTLGLVLFVVGFAAMNWAEATLGKQFSVQVTIQDGHMLVTEGLYRYVRHPRYLGIIVYSVGLSVVFRSWLTLVLVAVLIGVLLWRIHDEEALMRQEFGVEWQSYASRSWRLVPFVY